VVEAAIGGAVIGGAAIGGAGFGCAQVNGRNTSEMGGIPCWVGGLALALCFQEPLD
jgi:hypothetical protein